MTAQCTRATFSVEGRFPGLNEYTCACRAHAQAGGNIKRRETAKVARAAKGMPAVRWPVTVKIEFYEKDRRRDVDNIEFGTKFILDGLVKAGVIPDDSQKYVWQVVPWVGIDKDQPRVVVTVETAKGGRDVPWRGQEV